MNPPVEPRAAPVWADRLDAAAFWGLVGLLVWAPWPLGSNRPWASAVLAGGCWLMVVMAAMASITNPSRQAQPVRTTGAWLPLAALTAFCGIVATQLIPGLGPDGGVISVDPFHTRQYLLNALTMLGAWITVLLTTRAQKRAVHLLAALVAAGVIQALAAVALSSAGSSYQYFWATFDPGSRASGTFVNPDHLAGYMELCLSAGLGWLLAQLGQGGEGGTGWRARTVSVLAFVLSGKMLLRLLLVVMVIALVMTHSRMGNGAFFLGLALTGTAVAVASRQLRRPALWLVVSMLLIDVIIIGQWVGLDRVVQRMQSTAVVTPSAGPTFDGTAAPVAQEETLEQRLQVPLLSLNLVQDRPWFGHGGGTYYTAFPPFKTPGFTLQWWDHAHNDFVQVAADTGWVGMLLWVLVGVATLWRALKLLPDGPGNANRGVGVAAVMALCCMGLHSMVDFNLHIPSNALTFTVILAAVWGASHKPRRRRSAKPEVSVE